MARRLMDWRVRRKLGVTFGGCLGAARDLRREDPELFEAMSKSELSAAILNKIVGTPEGTVGIDWENIDWEALIMFIEQLIDLILKLIGGLQ